MKTSSFSTFVLVNEGLYRTDPTCPVGRTGVAYQICRVTSPAHHVTVCLVYKYAAAHITLTMAVTPLTRPSPAFYAEHPGMPVP